MSRLMINFKSVSPKYRPSRRSLLPKVWIRYPELCMLKAEGSLEDRESGTFKISSTSNKTVERPGIRGEILLQPESINGFYTGDGFTVSQFNVVATDKLVQNEYQVTNTEWHV